MTEYLNQQHPALRKSVEKATIAADRLFALALSIGARARLEVDRGRLEGILGKELVDALFYGSSSHRVYEIALDEPRIDLLRRIMSFGLAEWKETPWTAIKSVRLIDAGGATILCAGDMGDEILFALPSEQREDLLKAYSSNGIPRDVIETVDTDMARLEP